jgi:hypothetical protein
MEVPNPNLIARPDILVTGNSTSGSDPLENQEIPAVLRIRYPRPLLLSILLVGAR